MASGAGVVAYTRSDGVALWSADIGEYGVIGEPLVAGGFVITTDYDGQLVAIQ